MRVCLEPHQLTVWLPDGRTVKEALSLTQYESLKFDLTSYEMHAGYERRDRLLANLKEWVCQCPIES